MKIWLKMVFAIIIGILISVFLPNFKNIYENIIKPISDLAINSLLYITLIYILIKFFIGIIDIKKNKLFKKVFITFFVCTAISVLFSILLSIGIMNLSFFRPDNSFQQKSYNVINQIL